MITIHASDGSQMLETPKNSIDFCPTSPPYLEEHGYSDRLIYDLGRSLKATLKPNALAAINFGHVKEDPLRIYRVPVILSEHLKYCFTIYWAFADEETGRFSPQPIRSATPKPHNCIECIYFFCNGDEWSLDRLGIGVPYVDKSNSTRARKTGPSHGRTTRCRGSFWLWREDYDNKTGSEAHEHAWPVGLCRRLLTFANLQPGATIIDPFAGSGRVLEIADDMGYNAVGYETRDDRAVRLQTMADRRMGEKW